MYQADSEDGVYTASDSTYSASPRRRRSAGSRFSACLIETRRSPALVRTLTICSDNSRRSGWFRPAAVSDSQALESSFTRTQSDTSSDEVEAQEIPALLSTSTILESSSAAFAWSTSRAAW